MRPQVSAIVPTFNNETIIRRCLASLTWVDELLVVDSFSSDATVEICRGYGARILQHSYENSARQKNWAIPQAQHAWVLVLDSDEVLEAGFAEELRGQLASAGADVDGFRVRRKNLIYGQWVRHGGIYPDTLVRVFRRSCRYHDRTVHAHLDIPAGRLRDLQHHIIHHDFTDMHGYLLKLARYTRYERDQLVRDGKRFRLRDLALRPAAMFAYSYFYQQGFRDGLRGYLVAQLKAGYNFLIYLRLWEAERGWDAGP